MHNYLMWVDENIHIFLVHTCQRTCEIDRRLSFVIFTGSKISHNLFTAFFTRLNISHVFHTYFTWLTPVVPIATQGISQESNFIEVHKYITKS